MSKIAVYSPQDVKVYLGGVYELDGFIEGTFIAIEKIDQLFSQKITSDGMVVRSHKGNMAYRVNITLANTSESNQVLTYLMLVDFATQVGKFPLMIKDHQGSSLLFSPSTWIESQPKSNFGLSVEPREWTLVSPFATLNLGGNYEETGVAMDVVNTLAGAAGGVGAIGDLGGIIGGILG